MKKTNETYVGSPPDQEPPPQWEGYGSRTDHLVMRGVAFVYPGGAAPVSVLKSIDCRVRPGDRIAVTGPSGSGKTTLLNVMGGLDDPSAGSVSWPALGTKSELRPSKSGFVFQSPALVSWFSVQENIQIPLLLAGAGPEEARSRAEELLDRFSLRSLADKLPGELSGGQAQRISVLRALSASPAYILADEPTGQLDHPTAEGMIRTVFELLEGLDTSLVVATHDRAVAERMDSIWHLENGHLESIR